MIGYLSFDPVFHRRVATNYDDFLNLVRGRRSIRRFKDKPVDRETVEKILEAARHAPSAANSQPWEFVVVQDAATKKTISKSIAQKLNDVLDADPTFNRNSAVQPHLFTAPVIIAVCGDPRLEDSYPMGKVMRNVLFRQSLANCIYTIQLAAACFGLASAWATIQGGPIEAEVKKVLGIPDSYTVDHIVPLGYPDEEAAERQPALRVIKDRAPFRRELKEMVHYEHYDPSKFRSDEAIKEFILGHTVTRISGS